MKRARTSLILSIVFLVAAPVHATEKRLLDGNGSNVPIDIAWIQHGHRTNGHGVEQLVHKIRLHERWPMRRLRHRGFIHVSFQLRGHPNNPEERTIWILYKKGELRATMYNTIGDPPAFRGRIPVHRPNPRTIKLAFHKSLLRRHISTYRWRAMAYVESGAHGCHRRRAGCADYSPNLKHGLRYIRHNL